MDKAGQRQRGHVSDIAVVEMAAPAHRQHGGNALQIQVALFGRQRACRVHDSPELRVREADHAGIMPRRRRASKAGETPCRKCELV